MANGASAGDGCLFFSLQARRLDCLIPSYLWLDPLVYVLLRDVRQTAPECSVLDLKAQYRGYTYVRETIKLLPEPPDEHIMAQMFRQVANLGRIHPTDAQLNAA